MNCIKCGNAADAYHFRVLQVQTLHVRDFGKNSKIQVLGGFEEYDVCAACAKEKYRAAMDDGAAMKKRVTPYAILLVLGLIVTGVFWSGEGVFRLLGLAMAACGVMGAYGTGKSIGAKKRELTALSEEDALYRCAWECLLESAPKKDDINDITYIPVDEQTLARKNGDLMILYDLLPEIAIQAHKRIHGVEETE